MTSIGEPVSFIEFCACDMVWFELFETLYTNIMELKDFPWKFKEIIQLNFMRHSEWVVSI